MLAKAQDLNLSYKPLNRTNEEGLTIIVHYADLRWQRNLRVMTRLDKSLRQALTMRLITDCDGVLVDLSERYYRVYQFCLDSVIYPSQSLNRLTKAEFWGLKRSQTSEAEIGCQSGLMAEQIPQFVALRKANAHAPQYFHHDVLIPGVIDALHQLRAANVELIVMTLRRDRELGYAFKKYPELAQFFTPERCYCVADDAVKSSDTQEKPKLMERAIAELSPIYPTWMVGDTESDIFTARAGNIPVISVLSGIRNQERLQPHQPDQILPNFSTAAQSILKQL